MHFGTEKVFLEKRSSALCYLRIIATIVVIASHAWSTLTENTYMFSLTISEKVFINILSDMTKWAVPCFFMVTGALLLKNDKEVSVKDCIWKWARRMLLALVIFGVPYSMLIIFFETGRISYSMIPEAIIQVINGDSFGHLWYLYTMIGIYLFLPFIKLFVNNASRQEFRYVVIIIFIFNFCFPFIDKLLGTTIAFEIPLTTYPLFYLMMGYFMFNKEDAIVRSKIAPYAVIAGATLLIIGVDILSNAEIAIMSYNTPINALCTLSIFSLFIRTKKASTDRLWKVDRLCFGTYLIHPLFIQFQYKFLKVIPTGNSFYPVQLIVFALAFVIMSFAASLVMSQIKSLKKYVL